MSKTLNDKIEDIIDTVYDDKDWSAGLSVVWFS